MVEEVAGKDIQIENGEFTRIHNAILEALARATFAPAQHRVLWFLFRKTYGFQQKEDKISLTQWEEGTQLSRPALIAALQSLVTLKVMYRLPGDKYGMICGFNKYVENWDPKVFERDASRSHRFSDHTGGSCTGTPETGQGVPVQEPARGSYTGTPTAALGVPTQEPLEAQKGSCTATSASKATGTHKRNVNDESISLSESGKSVAPTNGNGNGHHPTPDPAPVGDPAPWDQWDYCLRQLGLQMTKGAYSSWLWGSSAAICGDRLTVFTQTSAKCEWLDLRLRPVIERTARAIAQRPLVITFAVKEKA